MHVEGRALPFGLGDDAAFMNSPTTVCMIIAGFTTGRSCISSAM
jgi:hypothetical protein